MTAGYSGTPLAKKLGIRENDLVVTIRRPGNYLEMVSPFPEGVILMERAFNGLHVDEAGYREAPSIVHLFTNSRDELFSELADLRSFIRQDGAIWVSWYKKAANLSTEVTEDVVREAALPLGLVDVKVCAFDEKWSALKLVIRRENRL